LRVFPDREAAIRARMQANDLSEPVARLLVERGTRAVDGGFVWSSDPRLTIATAVRMTEGQVRDLVAHIECPTRVLYADPAPPYFPEQMRRERAALLPRGEVVARPGTHHLHMEDPQGVAEDIGAFFNGA
jgi:pimeloyl-ACP methyl ester carboxylesterase